MSSKIGLEQRNRELVGLATENARQEADAKAYGVSALMKALADVEPKTLQALARAGMDSSRLIALAFRELAEGADKIGQLNVSPDLLQALVAGHKPGDAAKV